MHDFDILFDSDGLVALFVEQDAHHQRAKTFLERLAAERKKLVVSTFIVAEAATVISRLAEQELARQFLTFARSGNLPLLRLDEELEHKTFALFVAQDKKRTSVFDCSNVVLMQTFNIPVIFSFDHFYKEFGLKTIADL